MKKKQLKLIYLLVGLATVIAGWLYVNTYLYKSKAAGSPNGATIEYVAPAASVPVNQNQSMTLSVKPNVATEQISAVDLTLNATGVLQFVDVVPAPSFTSYDELKRTVTPTSVTISYINRDLAKTPAFLITYKGTGSGQGTVSVDTATSQIVGTVPTIAFLLDTINNPAILFGTATAPDNAVNMSFAPAAQNYPENTDQTITLAITPQNTTYQISALDIVLTANGSVEFSDISVPTGFENASQLIKEVTPGRIRIAYASQATRPNTQATITLRAKTAGTGTVSVNTTSSQIVGSVPNNAFTIAPVTNGIYTVGSGPVDPITPTPTTIPGEATPTPTTGGTNPTPTPAEFTEGEPPMPSCPANHTNVAEFGGGIFYFNSTRRIFDKTFTVNSSSPKGKILTWQGEGHNWDYGCKPGPNNDNGKSGCDAVQANEIVDFTVNGSNVGKFTDHNPDDDKSYFYTFELSNLKNGSNTLHIEYPTNGGGSVFAKGIVCAENEGGSNPPPTTAPGGATATPTTAPGGAATPTPTPIKMVDMKITIKVKFQGMLTEQLKKLIQELTELIQVTIEGPSKIRSVVTVKLNKETGMFEGTIRVKARPGEGNKVTIKGRKHLRKAICRSFIDSDAYEGKNCKKGEIKLVEGDNVLDATGALLLAGDLSPQDGVVDSFDLSIVRARLGKKDADSLAIADLNSDGIVDTQDMSLVVQSLNYKFDDESNYDGKSGQGQGTLLDTF